MKKQLLGFATVLVICAALDAGCSESSKRYEGAPITTAPVTTNIAPITTITVTYWDSLTELQKQELLNTIKLLIQALLEDYPGTITISILNNYIINIINTEVIVTIKGNKFLVWCGQYNECPNLYEALCLKILGENHPNRHIWKNRGKQIENECKVKNGH